MSKKSKRAKLIKPMKQLQQCPSALPQIQKQLVERIQYTQQQMQRGDFAGCISACETLLNTLPKHSEMRPEVLALQGLANGMLQNYQQSYDIFSEAISLDPTRSELWYNHGLAAYGLGRLAESVRDHERAVELSKNGASEIARTFADQLREKRQKLQETMQLHGEDITLEQYAEREEHFTQAVRLTKQEKWPEAELLFRQLTETGARIAAYWGNLGVCLMAQLRYEEAKEALKQALVIDPDYPIARDNLKALSTARRSKIPVQVKTINLSKGNDVKQSLTLYEKGTDGETGTCTVIEKMGHAVTSTWRQLGKQPPRYDLFLNSYQDARFTTCPHCNIKTQSRKFSLVVNIHPNQTIVIEHICRFCNTCDLLILHQDELEDQLVTTMTTINPEIIGNDYQVVGTLEREEWNQGKQDPSSYGRVVEYLHDFKQVVTFSRVPVEE
jgi:tetratricopeptide (TPR) repeat protein